MKRSFHTATESTADTQPLCNKCKLPLTSGHMCITYTLDGINNKYTPMRIIVSGK